MTYDNNNATTVVGYCPYSCIAYAREVEVHGLTNEEDGTGRQNVRCLEKRGTVVFPVYAKLWSVTVLVRLSWR